MPEPIPVRARFRGYLETLREPGDEFTVADEQALAPWMERLDGKPHTNDDAETREKVLGRHGVTELKRKEAEAAAAKAKAEKGHKPESAEPKGGKGKGSGDQAVI